MYIATALPAVANAAWSILVPDLKEAIHVVTGRSALCNVKITVRDVDIIHNPYTGPATSAILEAGEWFDLATWYAFIFGIAADGLIDWTSNTLKFSGCDVPPPAENYGYGNQVLGGWNASQSFAQWLPGPLFINPQWPDTNGLGAFVLVKAKHRVTATFQYRLQTIGGIEGPPFATRVRWMHSGEIIDHAVAEPQALRENYKVATIARSTNWDSVDRYMALEMRTMIPPISISYVPIGPAYGYWEQEPVGP